MRVIALINQKGGVGKTTTAANLGAGLTRLGNKVLLIDIDPQANLSLHLDMSVINESKSVYDLLVRDTPMVDLVKPTSEPGLDIIPSHIDLCSAELELVNTVGREIILRDALSHYIESIPNPPDYVLIDCPPSLGLLSLNALSAAKEIIIPIQAEFFALQGMGKLVEVMKVVESRINPDLSITGIVVCMYKAQTTLAKEVISEVKSFFGDIIYDAKIRQNIKLAEAPGYGKSIFEYEMNSNGARDYMDLAIEVAGERKLTIIEDNDSDDSELKEPQSKEDLSAAEEEIQNIPLAVDKIEDDSEQAEIDVNEYIDDTIKPAENVINKSCERFSTTEEPPKIEEEGGY